MENPLRLAAAAAVLAAIVSSASSADRPVDLRVPPDVSQDLSPMPQIVDPADDAERRINAALRSLDGNVRKASLGCKTQGRANSWWERNINVPMRGPRYLSLEITDNLFCGGAHPDVSTIAIVYDLTTGAPVDWTTLLPSSLTGKVALAAGADGTKMVTLSSKRLHALYPTGYRPKTSDAKVDEADKECRDAVTNSSGEAPAMMAWLNAKAGGLAVQYDLPHAVQACADAVVIPVATLRQEGAQAVLTDAIEAAHLKQVSP